MAERILLIEDDDALGRQVVGHLRRAGYEPVWLTDGAAADPRGMDAYDLVVLDLMLPHVNGLDLLKLMREHCDVPVLILSARDDSTTRVRGLQLGADDFLIKPFWPEELIERVRARLRRPLLQRMAVIEVGPLMVDLNAHSVSVEGGVVSLTPAEFSILATLARRRGSAVTRQALAEQALEGEREGAERTLDVHVSRLRKKLGAAGTQIATVWGIGYRLGGPSPR